MSARNLISAYEDCKPIHNPKMDALVQFSARQLTCSHCGKCRRRCRVLGDPGLDIGKISETYRRIMDLPENDRLPAVLELVQEDYLLYNALRQCCFCGFCTAACPHHVLAPEEMRAWRELFSKSGLMPAEASKLVMVDNEWNIFSAYRAIYGIGYPEFLSLDMAAEAGPGTVDTLFFPGCSLVSYAPDLMRAVGEWLTESGVKWALSDGCCGSPLMSAGLFERAKALRAGFIEKMQRAGITRMVTVCPGCTDEFADDMPKGIEIVPLPKLMIELAEKRKAAGQNAGFNPIMRDSLTFFDSCHDRANSANGNAIRALMREYIPQAEQRESEHFKRGTLCCGAGGAVASYDTEITDERVWRVIEEARATGAQTLVTMCPTCAYTIAQACISKPELAIESRHYLEMLFGVEIDWDRVFAELGSMWTGEYAEWLNVTFF